MCIRDSRNIVLSRIKGSRGSLYRMTASGQQLHRLTMAGNYSDQFADWGTCQH